VATFQHECPFTRNVKGGEKRQNAGANRQTECNCQNTVSPHVCFLENTGINATLLYLSISGCHNLTAASQN